MAQLPQQKSTNTPVFWQLRAIKDSKGKTTNLETTANSIIAWDDEEKKSFTFNAVLSPETSQTSLFRNVALPMCEEILDGYNSCILVYGKTGSGKTYCLYGTDNLKSNVFSNNLGEPLGIIAMSIRNIFEELNDRYSEKLLNMQSYTVEVSFYEIFKDELVDLIENENKSCQIKQEKVTDLNQSLQFLKQAMNNYLTSHDKAHIDSHSNLIFTVTVTIRMRHGQTRRGEGKFIYLAGAEHIGPDEYSTNSLRNVQSLIKCLAKGKEYKVGSNEPLVQLLKKSLSENKRIRTRWLFTSNSQLHQYNKLSILDSLKFSEICKQVQKKNDNNNDSNKSNNNCESQPSIDEMAIAKPAQVHRIRSRRSSLTHDLNPKGLKLKVQQLEMEKIVANSVREELENQLEATKKQKEELKKKKKQQLNIIEMLTKRQNFNENEIKSLKNQNNRLTRENKNYQKQVKTLELNLEEERNNNSAIQPELNEINKLKRKIELLEKELQIETLNKEDLSTENGRLKQEIEIVNKKYDKLSNDNRILLNKVNRIEREWKSKYESLEQDCAALTTTISLLESQLIASKENIYNPTVVEDDFEEDIFGDIKVNGDDNIENIQQNIHNGENMESLNEKKNVQVENKQMEDLHMMEKNIDDNNDSVRSESPEIETYASGDESSEQDSDSKMEQDAENNKNNCDSKQSDDRENDIEEVDFPQSGPKKCLMFRHREVIHLSKIQDCLQLTQEYIEALTRDDDKLLVNFMQTIESIDNEFSEIGTALKERQNDLKNEVQRQFNDIDNTIQDSLDQLKPFGERMKGCISDCKNKVREMRDETQFKQRELAIKKLCQKCYDSRPTKIYQPPIDFKVSFTAKQKLESTTQRYGFVFHKTRAIRHFHNLSLDITSKKK